MAYDKKESPVHRMSSIKNWPHSVKPDKKLFLRGALRKGKEWPRKREREGNTSAI